MDRLSFRQPAVQLGLLALVALLLASALLRPATLLNTQAADGVQLSWQPDALAPLHQSALNVSSWSQDVRPLDAFAALQSRAAGPLSVHWSEHTGIPDWLTASDPAGRIPYTPSAIERGNPAAIARGFLDENRALFGLRSAADELVVARSDPDLQLNFSHVRMNQSYRGIPVFGKQLIVHLDPQEQIVALGGQFVPGINIATTPTLEPQQAEQIATNDLLHHQLTSDEAARVKPTVISNKTQLVVYVDAAGRPTLTWQVKIMTWSPLGEWLFFVNARRPAVVHVIDSSDHAMRRQTYSAGGTADIPGDLVIDEGERSSRDQIAQAAHDGAGKVYQFYFDNFKRDAYDNQGSPMISTVHFGVDREEQENAAWVSEYAQMIYGDGGRIFKPLAYGLDVIGHEFTHGVIDHTAQLVYEGQSGALNESYADVFGVLISGSDWEIGADVVKSPPFPLPYMRSLKDPNAGGNYDPNDPLSGVGQPASMEEYANLPLSRRSDNGGVHINSGIPNHVAYLISQAVGNDKLQQIYYRTMTQYLSPESDFLAAGNATLRAASELYGQADADAVRNAFGQVGITLGGNDNSPTPPPAQDQVPVPNTPAPPAPQTPQVPADCTDLVVAGDFESDNGWHEVTAKNSTTIIDTELPHSGKRSAWLGGTDQESFQYIYQDIAIPANATNVQLSYYRLLHEETTGGRGARAGEAKFSVVVAQPSGEVDQTLEELSSTQGDDAWRHLTGDLSHYAGKTIRLVFAVDTQPRNVSSMFVDDVSLIGCTANAGSGAPAPQPAQQNQVYIQGTVVDASTGRGISGAQVFILKQGISASQAAEDDDLTRDEVLTMGTTDDDGMYQTEEAVPRGVSYSAIVISSGYRPVLADGEIEIPSDAENPFPVDVTLRRGR